MHTFHDYPGPHRRFPTGAKPSPKHALLRAMPYLILRTPPAQFAAIPGKLDPWGNDQFGDCVTAEQAWAIAVFSIMLGLPEIFIDPNVVIQWARQHGVLDGADLTQVMDMFKSDGFQVGSQKYDNGSYAGVDYTNTAVLQSAISQGPVKLGMMSSALPPGAGNEQGWYALTPGPRGGEDHCTGLSAYGTAEYLYAELAKKFPNVSLPSGVPPQTPGFLHYTWATYGFVTQAWVNSAVGEAWERTPTIVGVPPLPTPVPPAPPVPPVTFEGLTLIQLLQSGTYKIGSASLSMLVDMLPGTYPLVRPGPTPVPPGPTPAPVLPPDEIAGLQQADALIQKILAEQRPH